MRKILRLTSSAIVACSIALGVIGVTASVSMANTTGSTGPYCGSWSAYEGCSNPEYCHILSCAQAASGNFCWCHVW